MLGEAFKAQCEHVLGYSPRPFEIIHYRDNPLPVGDGWVKSVLFYAR